MWCIEISTILGGILILLFTAQMINEAGGDGETEISSLFEKGYEFSVCVFSNEGENSEVLFSVKHFFPMGMISQWV